MQFFCVASLRLTDVNVKYAGWCLWCQSMRSVVARRGVSPAERYGLEPPCRFDSLACVQHVLELCAGVACVKAFFIDAVIGVKLQNDGVPGRVDFLWGLWGGNIEKMS